MKLSKAARRVIVDSIGLLADESARAMVEIYRDDTVERAYELLRRIDARRDFLSSAIHTYNEGARIREGFPFMEKQNKTELEKDLEV